MLLQDCNYLLKVTAYTLCCLAIISRRFVSIQSINFFHFVKWQPQNSLSGLCIGNNSNFRYRWLALTAAAQAALNNSGDLTTSTYLRGLGQRTATTTTIIKSNQFWCAMHTMCPQGKREATASQIYIHTNTRTFTDTDSVTDTVTASDTASLR